MYLEKQEFELSLILVLEGLEIKFGESGKLRRICSYKFNKDKENFNLRVEKV